MTDRFIEFLQENGYKDIRLLNELRYAAIRPLLFTNAIITGDVGNYGEYDNRWCYDSYEFVY